THPSHTHITLLFSHAQSSLPSIPPAPTEIYSLSLHDALPISLSMPADRSIRSSTSKPQEKSLSSSSCAVISISTSSFSQLKGTLDRKSTRLNSSHVSISYAVFCLKKKILVSIFLANDNNII